MRKHIPNIITGFRILCSCLIVFVPAFSFQFYILYALCGFSDMTDGFIARKTNSCSEFGSRFDTVADAVFAAAAMTKLLCAVYVPRWLWVWIIAVAVIKAGNVVSGFVRWKKLISMHTAMNRATGFLLFMLPFTLPFIELKYSSAAVCAVATFSAAQEGYYIRIGHGIKKAASGDDSM